MKCMYCGQDNPDGAVYCRCGRPLTLGGGYGGQMNPFPMQTPDMVKHRKAVPIMPIILVLLMIVAAGGFFYYRNYLKASVTDESKWQTISGSGYSIKAPKAMKKGEMLTVSGGDSTLLDFYTCEEMGFDVSVHNYTDEEKKMYGELDAKAYLAAYKLSGRVQKINGQELKFEVREGQNYVYAGYNVHRPNYVGKSDEVYYIESLFPYGDGYYQVNAYCAEEDKDKYEEYLLKLLDSFDEK